MSIMSQKAGIARHNKCNNSCRNSHNGRIKEKRNIQIVLAKVAHIMKQFSIFIGMAFIISFSMRVILKIF